MALDGVWLLRGHGFRSPLSLCLQTSSAHGCCLATVNGICVHVHVRVCVTRCSLALNAVNALFVAVIE